MPSISRAFAKPMWRGLPMGRAPTVLGGLLATIGYRWRDGSQLTTTQVARQYEALRPELEVLWGTAAAARFTASTTVADGRPWEVA